MTERRCHKGWAAPTEIHIEIEPGEHNHSCLGYGGENDGDWDPDHRRTQEQRHQFLIESLIPSLIGGMLGIGTGISGTRVLSSFTEFPTLLSAKAILLAFTFACSIGVFFGFYPARKASPLNPIEALRFE